MSPREGQRETVVKCFFFFFSVITHGCKNHISNLFPIFSPLSQLNRLQSTCNWLYEWNCSLQSGIELMEGKGTRELNNKWEDRMKDTALIHHNWFDNKNWSPFHSIANHVFSEFLPSRLSGFHASRSSACYIQRHCVDCYWLLRFEKHLGAYGYADIAHDQAANYNYRTLQYWNLSKAASALETFIPRWALSTNFAMQSAREGPKVTWSMSQFFMWGK